MLSRMTYESDDQPAVPASHRRRGVVVEALLEKLQRLTIGRVTLIREREQMRKALHELDEKLAEVQAQELELRAAVREYHVEIGPMPQETTVGNPRRVLIEARNWQMSRAKAQVLADGPPESGHLKSAVVAMVYAILQTVEYMHVRELYEMLKHQRIEVTSPQRLSQILSESSNFEADRTRGWSLKKVKS